MNAKNDYELNNVDLPCGKNPKPLYTIFSYLHIRTSLSSTGRTEICHVIAKESYSPDENYKVTSARKGYKALNQWFVDALMKKQDKHQVDIAIGKL